MVSSPPPVIDYAQRLQEEMSQFFLRTQKAMELAIEADDPKVGQTPRDVVWRRGRAELYHYRPMAPRKVATPLLMIHSLISKPYILDLYPGGSFVEFLLKQGFDVYLINWGTPTAADRTLRLEDYSLKMIPECVRRVAAESPTKKVSLLGYCMGGLLTIIYAALHPRAPIDAIISLATPVDFSKMGLFTTWTDQRYFDVDALVDRVGNVPAEFLRRSFSMLKPASEFSPVQYIGLWQNILNDRYVQQYRAFNKWTNDHIPFPGECFRQVTKDLQWENKLIKGELVVGGKRVDLSKLKWPFLAILGSRDHIVPLSSGELLIKLVGSKEKEQITLVGGHVGMVAGKGAVNDLWPRTATWLAEHSSKAPETQTATAKESA